MKKILLALAALMMVGCDTAIRLNVVNGTEYVVKEKRVNRNDYVYIYNLVKTGEDSWFDYSYKDTADFNVGDTLVITIRKVGN